MAHDFSFGPQYRLHSRQDYLRFFEGSDVFRLREVLIFRIPNSFGHFRLGITIKCKASSVERNRIKRIIRDLFRRNREQLGSFDYNVVIPSKKKPGFLYFKRLNETLSLELSSEIKAK